MSAAGAADRHRYPPGPMLTAIDHVGVAVPSIDDALALYRDSLGMALVHRETVAEQGVDAALLDVGDSHIELLQPLEPDTAGREVPEPPRPGTAPCRLPGGDRCRKRSTHAPPPACG